MSLKIFVAFALFLQLCSSLSPQVTIKLGTIRGTLKTYDGKKVNEFLGIPYAKPPVGELRFKKPQPLTEAWKEDLVADQWPNVCPQTDLFGMKKLYTANESEDCLYLNIWTPGNLEETIVEPKAVLVYIHGGGFQFGTSSIEMNNGVTLAAKGDIVVVTLNYRLASLGFLCGGNDEAPGNMGLYDQALALEWIQDNIKYFGGNPKQVTISGTSAGACSVSAHLLSPLSQNLFKNAIMMSGVMIENLICETKEIGLQKAFAFAKAVGCETDHEKESLSESTMKCLREADLETLFKASKQLSIQNKNFSDLLFMPIYGDQVLPDSPRNMLKTNRFKHNSNIMIGTLPNEGSYALILTGVGFTASKETLIQAVRNYFNTYLNIDKYSSLIEDAIKFYFTDVDGVDANVAALSLFGDFGFHCPSNIFAHHLSKLNKVFRYVFAYDVPMIFNLPCEHLTPCHGADFPCFFGTSLTSPSHIELSDDWIRLNTDFVKGKSDIWPSYYITKNDFVVPYYKDYRGPNYTRSTKLGYRNIQCEFWKSALYR